MSDNEFNLLKTEVMALRTKLDVLEKQINQRISSPSRPPTSDSPPSPVAKPPVAVKSVGFKTLETEWAASHTKPAAGGSTSRVLGVVSILCFVLASAFLIKLSIDSGWLTPARQVGMAGLFGLGLIVTGLILKRRDESYSALLPAAGVIVLYMTTYAGQLMHHLYDPWAATMMACAVSVGCIALASTFEEEAFFIVAAVGTYISPLLFPSIRERASDMVIYFLLWDVAFGAISIFFERRATALVAAYLALAVYAICSPGFFSNGTEVEITNMAVFEGIQFLIFLGGIIGYSIIRKKPLSSQEAWAYFPLIVFFYGIEYALFSKLSETGAAWGAIGFALLLFASHAFAKSVLKKQLESGPMVTSVAAAIVFHAGYIHLLPAGGKPWLALGLVAAFPYFISRFKWRGEHFILTFIIGTIVGVNFFKALFGVGEPVEMSHRVLLNMSFLVLLLVGYFQYEGDKEETNGADFWILIAGALHGLVGLKRIAHLMFTGSAENFAISGFWGLFALALLGGASLRKDRTLARSSLCVFAFAAGKVLLFDVSSLGSGTRVVCFLLLGAMFYIGGYLYRYVESWK